MILIISLQKLSLYSTYALLQVVNSTYALWTWHRNQDSYKENAIGDQIYIVRQPELCLKDSKVLVPFSHRFFMIYESICECDDFIAFLFLITHF